jgi:uncharacterized protein YndB with AHSA1/START domain
MAEVESAREMTAGPDSVWGLVSDPHRLADWVPTIASSHPAGPGSVQLRGESHGHDYDSRGRFEADNAARRLVWDSPRVSGYSGELAVTGHGDGSRVTIKVNIPDAPAEAGPELHRGLSEALDRIDQLTSA